MTASGQVPNVQNGSPPQRSIVAPWNYAGLIPRGMKNKQKDFYANVPVGQGSASAGAIAASGSATFLFTIDGDADFCALYLTGKVFTAAYAAVVTDPAILVDIVDSGSGRSWFSAPMLWGNLFGTAERPNLLGYPKICRVNAVQRVQLQNQVATAYVVNMAFQGFKVFPFAAATD